MYIDLYRHVYKMPYCVTKTFNYKMSLFRTLRRAL